METVRFERGDKVVKLRGYRFPGIVLCAPEKLDGTTIVLVECTAPETAGMVHVFNPNQLEKMAS